MWRKQIALTLLAALCAAGFAACGAATPPAQPEVPVPPPESDVLDFRLGQGVLEEPPGSVPFPLEGLLAVPEEESCPVVFLLHGAHGAEDVTESRYYQGFSYLAQALAQEGYLAISLNINRAFSFEPFEGSEYGRAYGIFQAYYDLLARANGGEPVFDVDLTGKADLSRLNFIGHSRGGDDSLYIAKQLQDGGSEAVRSVLLVSSPLMITPDESYTDVPTGVVLSQYDGDVTGLETATAFNRAWFLDADRQTPVTMAFLHGANHNQYNEAIGQADTLAPPQNVTYLDGDTQRAFLISYSLDFLQVFNHGAPLSQLADGAPSRLGFSFQPSVLAPGTRQLPDGERTGITTEGMEVSAVAMSQVPERNTIAPFNHPGPLEVDVPLYRAAWSQAGQSLTWEAAQGDWSQAAHLLLLLANDPTAPENTDGEALAVELRLTDQAGNHASVSLDAKSTPALGYHPTAVVDLFAGMEGLPPYLLAERPTPLATTQVPLSAFAGVNLEEIASVSLHGVSPSGALVLGGFGVD